MDSIIQYSEEIRDYLIGRIGKYTTTGEIEKTQILQNLPAPVCRWWMFEGKKYSDLNYSLASNWTKIAKAAKMLLNTFNPQWQALDVPEGHIDWPKTIRENIGRIIPVFVCDTSHLGLNPDEREALKVWINWISKEWDTYISEVGIPLNSEPIEPLYEVLSEIHGNTNMYTTSHIHRFAHIARRSRWPLLRNIIAESFRCYLETEELDKLPLPSNRETIYELFCLVRVLRCIDPHPNSIRWLTSINGNNEIVVPGILCKFQHSFNRQLMLDTKEFVGPLADAMDACKVRVPRFADILIRFDEARNGFNAILIEVKSGQQNFDAAIFQLKAYRAALLEQNIGRLLIWGIVEKSENGVGIEHLEKQMKNALHKYEDEIWVFSGHNEIQSVLQYAGITECSENHLGSHLNY